MEKLPEGHSYEDLRYANSSLAKVILHSYKELSRGKTPRKIKEKKDRCMIASVMQYLIIMESVSEMVRTLLI